MDERGPKEGGDVNIPALQALGKRSAASELVLARGVFSAPSVQVPDDLYAEIVAGTADLERDTLRLQKSATVTTNAYFGLLPASYFQRWTDVTTVQLKLAYGGSGPAQILLRACDLYGNNRTIGGVRVDGTGTTSLSASLTEFVDGGSLWMECTAIGGPLTITDVQWTAPTPAAIRPAAVVICTFNRPEACATTLSMLAGDKGVLEGIDVVYVIDQGTDSVGHQPRFAEVAAALGEKLVYLRQPNLGGTGGFARGLYEVSRITEHANVILMDDDILCEPDSVLRLNAFANLTPTPTIVGAQMLFLKNPRVLLAGAETADLSRLRAGLWSNHALGNVDVVEQRQSRRADATYTAWWMCLIPAEVIADAGLPLPFFVRWDDVEYGIRATDAGFPTVTLPNAAVWHADFHWKDSDDWIGYFDVRNALITAALHGGVDVATVIMGLSKAIATHLVEMRYGLAHTFIRAIEDFLAGPSVLDDDRAETLARIRAERSEFEETVVHPAVKTAELTDVTTPPAMPPWSRTKQVDLILVKRLLQQWSDRLARGPVAIQAPDAQWWHVSRFDYAVITDASQTGVRIRRRDKKKLQQLSFRAARTMWRFRAEAPSVQERYRQAFPRLISRENWSAVFAAGDDEV